jgi:hypothetical protein
LSQLRSLQTEDFLFFFGFNFYAVIESKNVIPSYAEIKWTSVYEVPPKGSGASSDLKQRKRELMLRPCFPPFHKESELPPQNSPAEVRAVVNDKWRVGDLVDLWCDGCFWSGKVIKLHGVDSVEVSYYFFLCLFHKS